ncbi:uncharacterized protein AB675_172 [Cyphellophora attinorum]|uniref:Uncharacterized protein n=1 Tax=Cyphellophora attinorum TaxID=1664694 RepID=A0A0N1H6C3_9EURO|nr:uncharacterized protein AB675_172 [Phialophora attinorum]KPI37676.1 hypothetical protein AB675_172 [Phialophora attinorum]
MSGLSFGHDESHDKATKISQPTDDDCKGRIGCVCCREVILDESDRKPVHVNLGGPEDIALNGSFVSFLAKKKLIVSQRYMSATSMQYLRNNVSNERLYEKQLNGASILFKPKNKYQFFWREGRLFMLTVEKSMRMGPGSISMEDS